DSAARAREVAARPRAVNATRARIATHIDVRTAIRAGTSDAAAIVVMRALLSIATLPAATTTAAAQPSTANDQRGRTRDNTDERGLTAEQVQRYARPYYPGIRACYFEFGRRAK